jgi:hypothetical protein
MLPEVINLEEIFVAIQEEQNLEHTIKLLVDEETELAVEEAKDIMYIAQDIDYANPSLYETSTPTTNYYYEAVQDDREERKEKTEQAKYNTIERKGLKKTEQKMEEKKREDLLGFTQEIQTSEELHLFKWRNPGLWTVMYDLSGIVSF